MNHAQFHFKKNLIYDFELPKNIVLWILNCTNKPITGYEHKMNENGETISYKEQVSETQFQMMLIADNYFKRGYSEGQIIDFLSSYFSQTRDCSAAS